MLQITKARMSEEVVLVPGFVTLSFVPLPLLVKNLRPTVLSSYRELSILKSNRR